MPAKFNLVAMAMAMAMAVGCRIANSGMRGCTIIGERC
jgi:hypothetical protein